MNNNQMYYCPDCGKWFGVENPKTDDWFVSYDEGPLSVGVWHMAGVSPVCPFDAGYLKVVLINMDDD